MLSLIEPPIPNCTPLFPEAPSATVSGKSTASERWLRAAHHVDGGAIIDVHRAHIGPANGIQCWLMRARAGESCVAVERRSVLADADYDVAERTGAQSNRAEIEILVSSSVKGRRMLALAVACRGVGLAVVAVTVLGPGAARAGVAVSVRAATVAASDVIRKVLFIFQNPHWFSSVWRLAERKPVIRDVAINRDRLRLPSGEWLTEL